MGEGEDLVVWRKIGEVLPIPACVSLDVVLGELGRGWCVVVVVVVIVVKGRMW